MKVLCIDENFRDDGVKYDFPTPVCGGEYNVISCGFREKQSRVEGNILFTEPAGIYYILREFSDMEIHSSHFAILPDTTADEMAEATRESIVNQETQLK